MLALKSTSLPKFSHFSNNLLSLSKCAVLNKTNVLQHPLQINREQLSNFSTTQISQAFISSTNGKKIANTQIPKFSKEKVINQTNEKKTLKKNIKTASEKRMPSLTEKNANSINDIAMKKRSIATLNAIKDTWKQYMNSDGFDTKNFKNLKLVENECLTPGKVVMEFKVEKAFTNRYGSLHGGFISSLVDIVGSMSVSSYGKKYNRHVSANINVSFMRGTKINDEVIVIGKCEKLGRSLAFTEVELYNKNTKKLLAEGKHTKFLLS